MHNYNRLSKWDRSTPKKQGLMQDKIFSNKWHQNTMNNTKEQKREIANKIQSIEDLSPSKTTYNKKMADKDGWASVHLDTMLRHTLRTNMTN